MELGHKIPSIPFNATNNLSADLTDYLGGYVVVYFYPKDATPGCTIEGQEFRDALPEFKQLNATIFGVSRDTLASHERFKTKQCFPFELICDSEEHLCTLFDVIKMKSMYGKQLRGIERSTFIIGPDGVLKHVWRKVSVKGHVAEVLATLKQLTANTTEQAL